MENINLIEILQAEWNRLDTEESEEHKHVDGETGGSGLWNCHLKDSLYRTGFDFPANEGIKAEKGGLWTGKWLHCKIQSTLEDYFTREAEHYDCVYVSEIYEPYEIIPGQIVMSPIDCAFLTKIYDADGLQIPSVILKPLRFKNVVKMMPFKDPRSHYIKIYDIKSAGNFGFYHTLEEGISDGYRAQFHGYMHSTGLHEITCLDIHKAKARLFTIVCPWNDRFWDEVIAKQYRKIELTEQLKAKASHCVKRDDLECYCDGNSIAWYSCPLSQTHEEINRWGEPKLKLDNLCKPAQEFYRLDALKKFRKGQLWIRGMSHVTIQEIRGNLIFSTNKGGTEFKDTMHSALQKFKPKPGQNYIVNEEMY